MPRVPLLGGFYRAESLIAAAQRCLNLYPEKNQPDEPGPVTTYLTPGLIQLAQLVDLTQVRCVYSASNGDLYVVCGANVYFVNASWQPTSVGTITSYQGPVSMADNSLVAVIVDGSASGWTIKLSDRTFAQINNGNGAFYGADRVDYVDTYFTFNRPGTNQFYISLSEVDYANMTGGPIVTGAITAGSGYPNGTYAALPLTGSATGTGATADITVAGNVVTAFVVDVGGQNYHVGDVLTADFGGSPNTATLAGGSGYTNGTHTAIALTGSATGTGCIATIVVAGGIVTSVTVTTAGQQYKVGDVLTATTGIGAGTGFTWTLLTLHTGSGFHWTVSTIGSSAFDPLDIAAKTGGSDPLATQIVMHREIWLLGTKTSEVWYNAGAADFTFAAIPGVFIEHGCIAAASVAKEDLSTFWLGQDLQGRGVVFQGTAYSAKRISTHAIENEIRSYTTVSDALGATYQQNGHVFYVLTFPSADRTWVYDVATELWHERAWIDADGNEHRIRANCFAYAYGTNVVGDWQNGKLYAYDINACTDAGEPIVRKRSFPHMMMDANRVVYTRFIADMQVGAAPGTLVSEADTVSLVCSDTRGASWGNPMRQPIGSAGQYYTSMQWRRLGLARDRVFEVFWSCPQITAINGAFVETEPCAT